MQTATKRHVPMVRHRRRPANHRHCAKQSHVKRRARARFSFTLPHQIEQTAASGGLGRGGRCAATMRVPSQKKNRTARPRTMHNSFRTPSSRADRHRWQPPASVLARRRYRSQNIASLKNARDSCTQQSELELTPSNPSNRRHRFHLRRTISKRSRTFTTKHTHTHTHAPPMRSKTLFDAAGFATGAGAPLIIGETIRWYSTKNINTETYRLRADPTHSTKQQPWRTITRERSHKQPRKQYVRRRTGLAAGVAGPPIKSSKPLTVRQTQRSHVGQRDVALQRETCGRPRYLLAGAAAGRADVGGSKRKQT